MGKIIGFFKKNWLKSLILFFILFMFIFVPNCYHIIVESQPNPEYYDEVEEYLNQEACCDFTWQVMCDEYKEKTNKTFDCFI